MNLPDHDAQSKPEAIPTPSPVPAQNAAPPVTRALALFVGGFSLLNVLGEFRIRGFDANLWWIDCRRLPVCVSTTLLAVSGLLLLSYALRPVMATWRRTTTAGALAILLGIALVNAVQFWRLLVAGAFRAGVPLPFSLLVAVALAVLLGRVLRPAAIPSAAPRFRRDLVAVLITVGICILALPLAQMYCFGKTDYRRPADVAVVFGARAYADGKCSDALQDRVTTACDLYRQRLVSKLIFSGGPGDGSINEPEAMGRLAVSLGVPNKDILLDPAGLNTDATVHNVAPLLTNLNATRILAVSHFYHLPRVKMRFHREGYEVYTVPAAEQHTLTWLPWLMAREVAAIWKYYAAPLAHQSD